MEHNPSLTPTYLAAAVDKSVKFAARDTMQLNGRRDRNCRYARIPDGTACDFCRMLGSRGFVYRSEFDAGGGNDYHPYCNCQVAVCFDPFIDKYDVVSESGTITTVTRGYGDGELVRPGRDGSYELRGVDVGALYDEYKAMGKKLTAKSKYKDYTRGAKLPDEDFQRAVERLEGARTLEELHEAGKAIVDEWEPNANGRDKRQWDELSRRAKELEKGFKSSYNSAGHDFVNEYTAKVSGLNIEGVDVKPENVSVQSYLSGKYGKPVPMGFDDADRGNCNPGSSADKGRTTNCQVCVSVYELRLRGYNVVAKSRPGDDASYDNIVERPHSVWIDRATGKPVKAHDFMGFDEKGAMGAVENETSEPGRYVLAVSRPGTSGHAVIVQRGDDGEMKAIDTQSGVVYGRESFAEEFGNAYYVSIARIDNADIDADAIADFIEVA